MASSKSEQETLASRVEREIETRAGVSVIVEESGDALIISGRVDTAEAKLAASDVAAEVAPSKRIDNDLEVEGVLPVEVSEFHHGVASAAPAPESVAEIGQMGSEVDADFTDQEVSTTSLEMAGVDVGEDRDETFFPPTDPVITSGSQGEAKVLGGFSATSDQAVQVDRSASDGKLGDEAIAEAVQRELNEDAATTDFKLQVTVRDGVVRLRGRVPDVVDAENAEAVAARVPGVREVDEQLDVENV
jgi:osmotically-inducible protein OsmY